MLRPQESKRDWFLFHMTPLGMGLAEGRKEQETDSRVKQITILVGGVMATGLLIVAYLAG